MNENNMNYEAIINSLGIKIANLTIDNVLKETQLQEASQQITQLQNQLTNIQSNVTAIDAE